MLDMTSRLRRRLRSLWAAPAAFRSSEATTVADVQILEPRVLLSGEAGVSPAGTEYDFLTTSDLEAEIDAVVDADGNVTAFYIRQVDAGGGASAYTANPFGEYVGFNTLVGSSHVRFHGVTGAINSAGTRASATSYGPRGSGTDTIYVRAYNADGSTPGFINLDVTSTEEESPSVAINSAGEILVVWSQATFGGGTTGIYAQRVGADMLAIGGAFQVNTSALGFDVAHAVGFDDAGNVVVAWQSNDGAESTTYLQRYDSNFATLGNEVVVDMPTQAGAPGLDLAVDGSGSFVLTWQRPNGFGGHDIYAQRFNNDGTTNGAAIAVATGTASLTGTQPQVALDGSGGFAVTWRQAARDNTSDDIMLRRFGADGSPSGDVLTVNTETAGAQSNPRIGANADGFFSVVWFSDADGGQIRSRRLQRGADPDPTPGQLFVVDGTNIYRGANDGGTIARTTAASDVTGTYEQFLYGDFNGDGHQDVAGFEDDGTWDVWTGDGTGSLNAQATWSTWDDTEAWQNILAGDFNNDGMLDIAARRADGFWEVGISSGTSFTTSVWGRFGGGVAWSDVMVGDFDGNGQDDIIGRNNKGNWYVASSEGTRFVNRLQGRWRRNAGWNNVVIGDFDGDGRADISGRTSGDVTWVSLTRTRGFTHEVWARWKSSAGWQNTKVGDFNGDGIDDIVSQTAHGAWWIGLSDGERFNAHRGARWSQRGDWNAELVVDMNGDGKDDLVGQTAQGHWWVSTSNDTSFTTSNGGRWDGLSGPVSYGASQLPEEIV